MLWGLVLRWIVNALIRVGLDRDITALVAEIPQAKLIDPLLADFADAADQVEQYFTEADALGREASRLATSTIDSTLGRLRRAEG